MPFSSSAFMAFLIKSCFFIGVGASCLKVCEKFFYTFGDVYKVSAVSGRPNQYLQQIFQNWASFWEIFINFNEKIYIYDYSILLPANFSLSQKAFGIPQISSIAKANSTFLNFLLYLFPAPLLLLVLRTCSFSSFQLSTPAFSLSFILEHMHFSGPTTCVIVLV